MVSSVIALPRGVENLCHRNRPGVFSRVSVFEPWIKKVTQGIVSFLRYKELDRKAQYNFQTIIKFLSIIRPEKKDKMCQKHRRKATHHQVNHIKDPQDPQRLQ